CPLFATQPEFHQYLRELACSAIRIMLVLSERQKNMPSTLKHWAWKTSLQRKWLQTNTDRFNLGVALQHRVAHLSAPTGLFVPAEGGYSYWRWWSAPFNG